MSGKSKVRAMPSPDFVPALLPEGLELQRTVLNAALEYENVAPGLEVKHFSRHANGVIWAAIQEAVARGLAPAYPIVHQILRDRGHLDAVGAPYLAELSRDGVLVRRTALTSVADMIRRTLRERELKTLVLRYAEQPGTVDLDQLEHDLAALRIAAGVGVRASFRTARELAEAAERVEWIVRGFAAVGAITELTGAAKRAGKTTLVAYIVACIIDGEMCLGSRAAQSPVVILTEQTAPTFREVLRRAGLLDRDDVSILSYWDVKGESWPTIGDMAIQEAARIGARVVVVDTLGQFAGIRGDGENNAGDAQEALAPVQLMAHKGLAAIVTRHARKSGGEVGEDGRGSTAFTGGVDIVLSLKRPEGNHKPTLRMLEGLSRFDETPAKIIIDKVSVHVPDPEVEVWTERFVVLGDSEAVAHDEAREALERYLPTTEDTAVTMAELLTLTGINRATVNRAMKGLPNVQTLGKGGKKDPLRYYRPEVDCVQTSIPQGTREQNRIAEVRTSGNGYQF